MFSPARGSATKIRGMTDFGDCSPRRYFVDENARRVLIGLTTEETSEFEALDSRSSFDGNHVASGQCAIQATTREVRWLELYSKHDQAWKRFLAET
jgi:hypothetical protein